MTIYKISLSDEQANKLADYLSRTSGEVDSRVAEEIKAQIPKPAIEEPTEFGSIVRATCDEMTRLWQRSAATGKHYWECQTGALAVWSELSDIEVLRVGIGGPVNEVGEYRIGVLNTIARGIRVLEGFRDQALTAEREDAYQNAINVLRELL